MLTDSDSTFMHKLAFPLLYFSSHHFLRNYADKHFIVLVRILLADTGQGLVAPSLKLMAELQTAVALLLHREDALNDRAHGAVDADEDALGGIDEVVGALDVGAHDGVLVLVPDLVDIDLFRRERDALGLVVRVPCRGWLWGARRHVGSAVDDVDVVVQLRNGRRLVHSRGDGVLVAKGERRLQDLGSQVSGGVPPVSIYRLGRVFVRSLPDTKLNLQPILSQGCRLFDRNGAKVQR